MRKFFTLLLCFAGFLTLQSQSSFKNIPNAPFKERKPIEVANPVRVSVDESRTTESFHFNTTNSLRPGHESIDAFRIMSSGSFWIDLKHNSVWQDRSSIKDVMDKFIRTAKAELPFYFDWNEISSHQDKQSLTHIKVQQTLAGIPIKN